MARKISIEGNPLMLWRVDTQEWVFWPSGRLRFYGHTHETYGMSGLLYGEYGPQAILHIYRARLGRKKDILELIFIAPVKAYCDSFGLTSP